MAFWLSPEVLTRDPIISPRAFALALALEVKLWKNTSSFFIYYNCFADIPGIFSPGRDQLLGRAGQKNISPGISPRISPLHDFWIPGLDSSI